MLRVMSGGRQLGQGTRFKVEYLCFGSIKIPGYALRSRLCREDCRRFLTGDQVTSR
jgi:hypothetical protein